MRKNDLQRDKAFRQRLAQKLEVEQPPESYFQAVQSAFASLPDELPVKARPIHQRVLRTCAALAACCAVVVAGAFGLNQVSPQLMESMPGIGQIFQGFNEGREPPVPTPSPTPPSETESQLEQQDVPPFEPISVPSNTGVGELTIQNAWSDGLYLHLELELAAEGMPFDPVYASSISRSISPCDDPYVEETDTSHLWPGLFLDRRKHRRRGHAYLRWGVGLPAAPERRPGAGLVRLPGGAPPLHPVR